MNDNKTFEIENYIIKSLNKPVTKEMKKQMYQMSDKVFYGEKLHVLDLTNLVDLFTFKLICFYRKENSYCSTNSKTITELTDDERANCAIDLYLELKEEGKVKIS